MARSRKTRTKTKASVARPGLIRAGLRWALRAVLVLLLAVLGWTLLYKVINPPTTAYIISEGRRGEISRAWVPLDQIAPVMARSAVAAEDANFCLHWGLDVAAIRTALDAGGTRGASTITQQVVKNVFLWHGRSWLRKALEAVWAPLTEAVWSKRRILELYLNVAEFDTGVFGVEAAAQHYFGVAARDLSALQAARLAAVLPDPKGRSASEPSSFVRERTRNIMDGAATIAADGRAACFED